MKKLFLILICLCVFNSIYSQRKNLKIRHKGGIPFEFLCSVGFAMQQNSNNIGTYFKNCRGWNMNVGFASKRHAIFLDMNRLYTRLNSGYDQNLAFKENERFLGWNDNISYGYCIIDSEFRLYPYIGVGFSSLYGEDKFLHSNNFNTGFRMVYDISKIKNKKEELTYTLNGSFMVCHEKFNSALNGYNLLFSIGIGYRL